MPTNEAEHLGRPRFGRQRESLDEQAAAHAGDRRPGPGGGAAHWDMH
jgi:hypothetical protein